MNFGDSLKIKLQHWLPKQTLTELMGYLADCKAGPLTHWCIKRFVAHYNVNMSEALDPNTNTYPTFNSFFTRQLQYHARPINSDSTTLCFPADACVSQFGTIQQDRLIQAKNHDFRIDELLAGDEQFAPRFVDGEFATLYLSPRDYHRVHMPCDGTLIKMSYVPGELYSVNPLTAEHVPQLFARNERVICYFDTPFGLMAQVLVGATIVGSIVTSWAGAVTPPRGNTIYHWYYDTSGEQAIHLKKGQEMGQFKLGSTVINLFEPNHIIFDDQVQHGKPTRMGEAYAHQKTTANV